MRRNRREGNSNRETDDETRRWRWYRSQTALLMGGFEGLGDLLGNGQRLVERDRPLLDAIRQRRPLYDYAEREIMQSDTTGGPFSSAFQPCCTPHNPVSRSVATKAQSVS